MKNLVSIPNPCHASWDKMKPHENGRHCKSCDKVVVDFTSMSDEELRDYFKQHQSQKFCGHFRKEQVKRLKIVIKPKELTNQGWDIYQISKVAIFLVFFSSLFSCALKNDDGSSAEIVIENATDRKDSTNQVHIDAITLDGRVAPMELDTIPDKKAIPKHLKLEPKKEHIEILGEPEIVTVTDGYEQEILTGIPRLEDE